MKKFLKKISKLLPLGLVFCLVFTMFGCKKNENDKNAPINAARKDYDIFIYNSNANIGSAFRKMCDEYTAKTGVIIRTVTPSDEVNNFDNLKDYLASEYPPDIFTVSNMQDLKVLKENSQIWDFSNATEESFKEAVNNIPENLRLSSNTTDNFGVPYNVEGFGMLVDPKMVASLFGGDKYRLVLNDLKECSYEEFSGFINALNLYINSDVISEFTLNNNSYTFVSGKGEMSKNLNGVFSFPAGVSKYVGNYLINIPLSAIFATPAAANVSNEMQVNGFKDVFMKFTDALETITLNMSGPNGPLGRGSEFVSNTQNSTSQAMKNFVGGKALFLIASTEDYNNLSVFDLSVAKRSVFIPIKMPILKEDVSSSESIAKNINKSITAYVPNYYCINANSSPKEKKAAQDFLTWVQTSDVAKRYIISEFELTPYDSKEGGAIDNAFSRSLIEYMTEGRILPPVFEGTPNNWNNSSSQYIIEQFFTKGIWSYEDHEKIAGQLMLKWKELR